MMPYIITHNAVSIDGRLDWIEPDLGLYYKIASKCNEDATLVGSGTMLAAPTNDKEEKSVFEKPSYDPDDNRPILVILDSKGVVRNWHTMMSAGYWKRFVALCSKHTPKEYLDYLSKRHIEYIISGDEKVDIEQALERLYKEYKIKRIRVDSGGTLNGVLLRLHLVDEISIFIVPSVVGGITPKNLFVAPDLTTSSDIVQTRLESIKRLDDDSLWLRYSIKKEKIRRN